MENDKHNRKNPSGLKRVSNNVASIAYINGCDNGHPDSVAIEFAAHSSFHRLPQMVNGQAECVGMDVQCNNCDLTDNLESEGITQLQKQGSVYSQQTDGKNANTGRKEMNINMNGLGVRLNAAGYSRVVCNMYRHENDLIYGRTRGGIVNSRENVVVGDHAARETDDVNSVRRTNGHPVDVEFSRELAQNSSRQLQGLTAPLATPESFSDEEGIHEDTSVQKRQACYDSDRRHVNHLQHVYNASQEQSAELLPQGHLNQVDNGSDTCIESAVNETDQDAVPNDSESSVSSDSLICDDFEPEVRDIDEVYNNKNGAQGDEVSTGSDVDRLMEDLEFGNNVVEEPQQEVENNVNFIAETDVDSNEGDFIEADFPPNVERLAFFSRDSTSDEDEGCGDEMLPANDEDVVSDNETIDPTDGGYMSPSRSGEHKVLNSEQPAIGACNVLSADSTSVRGESSSLYPCNISCDKSTEENDDYVLCSDCRCLEECRVVECSSCNVLNHPENSAMKGDSNSVKGNNLCACCDRPMVVNNQRRRELGINVCDKCFKELNAEQSRWFENGAKHRTWPGSRSCSSSGNFLNRNCGNSLMPLNNNYDKVSNNSFNFTRFSSSDSDPYDRIYVSDSSDADIGGESSVFQSSSIASSCGTVVQFRQSSEERNIGDSRPLHRQSASLDYTSPEEILYCPYYTRRSRSLDQQLLQSDDHIHIDDGALACEDSELTISSSNILDEEVNTAIPSSNFRDDDVNTQKKVFEKQAYNVPVSGPGCNVSVPIPSCSSSDEEENIRMPGVSVLGLSAVLGMDSLELITQSDLAANLELSNDNMLYGSGSKGKHSRGQKMRLDDNEPIYEDIDQLELLLEDGERECETSGPGTTQPLCNAMTKLRRKRRARSPVSDVEKVMIWNEYEAYVVQVKQIGTSACGPTAVLNVLKAFDFQVEKEEVAHTIRSNLRMEAAPIPYYLFSRYNAGTTAQDLVDGVTLVTRGAIRGRFFHFHPPREVELLKWLGHWMKKGAVPVATLNLQRGVKPGWTIPDAWHHQMVYGVSSKGIYLTNPLEIVPQSVIMEQLTSDSVLLVRRQDVVGRFRDWCPLNEIIKQRDLRWRTMNVLGQTIHMLREQHMPSDQMLSMRSQLMTHVCIPAAYKAGIILFMRANCESVEELMATAELPMKEQPPDT